MKIRISLVALLVVGVLVTSVCRKDEATEELPKDIAAQLQRVPNSELLVSVPPVPSPQPAAKPTKPAVKSLAPPCSSTTTYLVQVTYPVTVCSNVRDLATVLANYDALMTPPGTKSSNPSTEVKNYKLSSFQGKTLTSVFCHVRSGPWLATIVKKVDCLARGSCQMSIGIPSSPIFLWNGQNCESENRPQDPLLHYIDPPVSVGMFRTPCNTKNTCQ